MHARVILGVFGCSRGRVRGHGCGRDHGNECGRCFLVVVTAVLVVVFMAMDVVMVVFVVLC